MPNKDNSELTAPAWETVEEVDGWDYDSYHIRTTNEHDHSELMRIPANFKLPISLQAQIVHWMNHPLTPYQGVGSFLRDACAHRAAYLLEREGDGALPEFTGSTNFQKLIDAIASQQAFEIEQAAGFREVEKRATFLAQQGNVKSLEELYEMAKAVQVEPQFRGQWVALIEDLKIKCDRLLPLDMGGLDD